MHRDDLADMSIDERLDELASLLATGFLRLKRRTGCVPSDVSSLKPLPHGRGSDRNFRERGKFENPGGFALPAFGNRGPRGGGRWTRPLGETPLGPPFLRGEAASADAAVSEGRRSNVGGCRIARRGGGRWTRPLGETPLGPPFLRGEAASADAALIDGHGGIHRLHRWTQMVGSADAALIDGHGSFVVGGAHPTAHARRCSLAWAWAH